MVVGTVGIDLLYANDFPDRNTASAIYWTGPASVDMRAIVGVPSENETAVDAMSLSVSIVDTLDGSIIASAAQGVTSGSSVPLALTSLSD